jgi:hypothetical protein
LEREIITSIRLAHRQKIGEGNNNLHQVSSVKRLEREIITSIRLADSQKIGEGNNNLHQVSS